MGHYPVCKLPVATNNTSPTQEGAANQYLQAMENDQAGNIVPGKDIENGIEIEGHIKHTEPRSNAAFIQAIKLSK